MNDKTQELVNTLDPAIAWRAATLINALRSAGVPAGIVTGGARRTVSDQLKLYKSGLGVTSTRKSRHITGMAFDLDILGMNRNDVPQWFWDLVGPWAESNLGLIWGGRWHSPYDPGHFQL